MNTADMVRTAVEYGITPEDMKIAGAVELLVLGKLGQGKEDLETVVKRLATFMSEEEVYSTIKWATWTKRARELDGEGIDVDALLKVRKEQAA